MGRRRAHARLAWEGAAKTGVAERPEPRTGRVARRGRNEGEGGEENPGSCVTAPRRPRCGAQSDRRSEIPARPGREAPAAPTQNVNCYGGLKLVHMNSMGLAETAEFMGKTKGAVAGLVRRGQARLREFLKDSR